MIKNRYPGKFIVIEGLDGAGKSTQAAAIADYVRTNYGCQICVTHEPTQLLIGGLIRGRLLNEWNCTSECLQLLYAADRADHLEKDVRPLLEQGMNVISDRYFLSSLAFGGVNNDMDWLEQINSQFIMPDIIIYLDLAPEICVKRMADNGRLIELFDKVDTLREVSLNYKKAIDRMGGRIKTLIIDGNQPINVITKDIVKNIRFILK